VLHEPFVSFCFVWQVLSLEQQLNKMYGGPYRPVATDKDGNPVTPAGLLLEYQLKEGMNVRRLDTVQAELPFPSRWPCV